MWTEGLFYRFTVLNLFNFLQVMEPFLTALTENIENRFPNTSSLSVFSVFSPRQILSNSSTEYGDAEMRTLAEQFPRLMESDLLSEWSSYRLRVGIPDLKLL